MYMTLQITLIQEMNKKLVIKTSNTPLEPLFSLDWREKTCAICSIYVHLYMYIIYIYIYMFIYIYNTNYMHMTSANKV